MTLYDKDVLISDELTSIVFDVGGMKPGQPLLRTFKLNPKVGPQLFPSQLRIAAENSITEVRQYKLVYLPVIEARRGKYIGR